MLLCTVGDIEIQSRQLKGGLFAAVWYDTHSCSESGVLIIACCCVDAQLSVEDEKEASAAAAPGVDEKDGAADAPDDDGGDSSSEKHDAGGAGNNSLTGSGGSGSGGGQRSNDDTSACAAAGCEQQSRIDSRFCCDGCGVRDAEAVLSGVIRYTLEPKIGIERGRRLRETRELKTRKQQVKRGAGSKLERVLHTYSSSMDRTGGFRSMLLLCETFSAGRRVPCENIGCHLTILRCF